MQAKINTGMYRESEDDPDEEPDDAYDPFIRFDGRQQEVQPEMLGGSRPGYQYEPPTEGADLIGYKIRATFPTGPLRELCWLDGYVIDYSNNAINYDYLFFYEIDENSEWIRGHQLPHRSICFRKRAVAGGPRVSEEMVAAAKRMVG